MQQQTLLGQLQRLASRADAAQQKTLAAIEQRIQEQNARPRTRYLGPSVQEAVYAHYYDHLRRQIEALGTRHFPRHLGHPLYGSLTLILTVDAQGQMAQIETVHSSGSAELDRQARAIANAAAPFGEFSDDIKRQADRLAWVVRFTFSAESGLQTKSVEPMKAQP